MCFKRLKDSLRNRWIKRQFVKVHAKYASQFNVVEIQRRAQINAIWNTYKCNQILDYISCIDSRLYFIASMLPVETVAKIHECKQICFRNGDFDKIVALTEIVCRSDVESIEVELSNLIQAGKTR
jgi:hypothetical protein